MYGISHGVPKADDCTCSLSLLKVIKMRIDSYHVVLFALSIGPTCFFGHRLFHQTQNSIDGWFQINSTQSGPSLEFSAVLIEVGDGILHPIKVPVVAQARGLPQLPKLVTVVVWGEDFDQGGIPTEEDQVRQRGAVSGKHNVLPGPPVKLLQGG
jgi:hypothetical protein